ncbi:MAG: tyrosine-type recombinase/integrase [Candidatus Woesearchaeota archaeon]
MDIHNYKGRLERTLKRIDEAGISKQNKDLILKFKDYCISEGIGLAKIERYLCDLKKYAQMLKKNLEEASKEDIRMVVAELEQTNLSAETKKGFKIMLRKFYRFAEGIEEKGVYPERVKWLSINIPNNHKKMPEELLTEEEMARMIQKCETLRDKALVATLAASGCRIGEVGTLQVKHVSFEEYGARLTVRGKTGMRKILVINSAPYLQQWINQHPYNDNPESYLWISNDNKPLCYTRFVAIIKRAARDAGVTKRVYSHLFRHSRATMLAANMSDASMKHYLGWTQGSKMAAVYIHMSGRETDEAILKLNGVEIKREKAKSATQPKKCLRCSTVNEATNVCCKICGLILDRQKQEEVLEQDAKKEQYNELMTDLVKDKEFLGYLLEKAEELKKARLQSPA